MGTGAGTELFATGWMPEVGCGPSYIVDVPFEIGQLGEFLGFLQEGVVTSGLYDPSLVEGKGTEGTAAKAAPGTNQTESDFFQGRDTSFAFIGRMVGSGVGQGKHPV